MGRAKTNIKRTIGYSLLVFLFIVLPVMGTTSEDFGVLLISTTLLTFYALVGLIMLIIWLFD